MSRVTAYVDGFNLYNGLKEKHGRKYLWLDLEAVVTRLLRPGQTLTAVRYFTASVRNDPGALARQSEYLGALAAHTAKVETVLGRFQEKCMRCRVCGSTWRTYEEKETDVSIAVALVEDAAAGAFDTALVVSADSDLCPAIRAVRRLRPGARIVAVFPPRRRSDELRQQADAAFTLGDAIIRQSLLPESVPSASGRPFSRPQGWR